MSDIWTNLQTNLQEYKDGFSNCEVGYQEKSFFILFCFSRVDEMYYSLQVRNLASVKLSNCHHASIS